MHVSFYSYFLSWLYGAVDVAEYSGPISGVLVTEVSDLNVTFVRPITGWMINNLLQFWW